MPSCSFAFSLFNQYLTFQHSFAYLYFNASVKLLKQKDKSASPEWLTKLPQMVKQLEVSLYRSAPSFEAYSDTNTLKHRLQQLAMEIARKTQQAKESGRSSSRGDRIGSSGPVPQAQPISSSHQGMGNMHYNPVNMGANEEIVSSQYGNPNDPEWKVRIRHKQQRLLLLHHSSKCPYDNDKCKVTPYCSEMKKLWKHMARCTDNECRVPHCFSSRSILSHYRKCKDPGCPACGPVRETVRKTQKSNAGKGVNEGQGDVGGMGPNSGIGLGGMGNEMGGGGGSGMGGNDMMGGMPMMGGNMNQMPQRQPSQPIPWRGDINSMPKFPPPKIRQQQDDYMAFPEGFPEGQQVLNGPSSGQNGNPESSKARHKQQRLLLLRHASKCNAEPGRCTTTPHCAEMKVLWKHIANCKDQYCKVKHCMSSRYVLSHYRRCNDPGCEICGPVREIFKSGTNHLIHDPSFMPGSSAADLITPPLPEGPQTKRSRTNDPSMNGMHHTAPARPAFPLSAPTSGSENHAKLKSSAKPSSSNATEEHSLLECFTTEQVKTHIQSLKKTIEVSPAKLKLKCVEILRELQIHEHGWVFATPVDPVELGLDDYFDVIKKPMDLGTISRRLDNGSYHAFDDFKSDVRLTFENAMKYNDENSVVHEMAKELKKKFDTDYKKLMKQLEKEHRENSMRQQACGLCGCEKLNFEPPVFFCNGMNCPSKRIRRNTHFYITADKQYAWCSQCYNELGGEIDLGTSVLKKVDLAKKKNDETHEESWVQCDDCERWIHQICGLYNTRQDKENKSAYSCPLCLLDKRKKEGEPKKLPPPPAASDIPRTNLSDWLERDVHKKVNQRLKELAREKADTEVRLS